MQQQTLIHQAQQLVDLLTALLAVATPCAMKKTDKFFYVRTKICVIKNVIGYHELRLH